ncbi:transporter substrate-binding domain-containing protein [Duganella sp. FT80W]|uniref:Transporter substrate-binding domain-containing protein n=1 Tax=Duganella guangzhouensis TaxID=2666084 RepID=A0A6I2L459_9BURK|nr:transporter substrate-binding domain-containing protein [Duganella guangzhouensis]MRW92918.1 transporter substrate-binding domain-containing protein [Duganella guangzhouensis]
MDEKKINTALVALRRRQLTLGLGSALMGMPYLARAAAQPQPLSLALIELMPWASTTPAGERNGILIDIAETLSALSGIDLQLRLLPYPRAAMMLQHEQVDLMVALQADRLDQVAARLAPLSSEDIVVVGRPGTILRSMADLKGKIVGRLRHAEYDSEFATTPEIIKYDTNTYRQSLEMLRIGRLDAVIFIRSALTFTLKSMQLTPAAVSPPLLIGRCPLTMYATRACISTAAANLVREACKVVYKRQTIRALADVLNHQTGDSSSPQFVGSL